MPVYVRSIKFPDPANGWAVGSGGTVFRTTDGGQTWSLQPTPVSQHLFSVWAIDGKRAWAAGMGGTILHTSNGGY